jgi:hypothetical protein
MTAHTPGPWRYDDLGGTPGFRAGDRLLGCAYPDADPNSKTWIASSLPEAVAFFFGIGVFFNL